MRALILIAAAVLALAACGKNDQAGSNANVDDDLTAENIVSNDVTAIDAVTGDAANMAADVDMNFANRPECRQPETKQDRRHDQAPDRQARAPGPGASRHQPDGHRDQHSQRDGQRRVAQGSPTTLCACSDRRHFGRSIASPIAASSAASRSAQSIGWTRKWSKPQPSSAAGIDARPAARPASARCRCAGRPRSRPWG